MNVVIAQTETTCALDAGDVRLLFTWRGDRWSHQILLAGSAFASSFEWEAGQADSERVVSPAYQQLLVQEHGGQSQVLTVGQWGRHHFSGVFVMSYDDGSARIDVDLAVRTRDPLLALASTYAVHRSSLDLENASPEGATWTTGLSETPRIRLEPAEPANGPSRVTLAESGRGETRVQVATPTDPRSANHRLLYRWRWDLTGEHSVFVRS
ncbi:MAG: hypothetical protein U0794_12375 [Isosphaeraceae bacterium]